ncbi:hypothetical protein EII17_07200 [Clostridiales bacterium COT073_COT-073]|nr:hypothetical protein EII17_07200 [Clostridiales bacterium COT073_COT-073]
MTLRRRGMIRSVLKWAGLVLVGMVIGSGSSFGYWYWQQAATKKIPPVVRKEVVSVNREIALGEIIQAEDISLMAAEEELIPAGALVVPEQAIGQRTWVKLVPKVILQPDFFYQNQPELMVNQQEIVVQKLPEQLEIGDYTDLRIQFPSGHDYCVLSHKQIGGLNQEKNMIVLGLSEAERVRMGSALADIQSYEQAYLYLSIYPRAVDMPDTVVRYPVNGSVQPLYEEITRSRMMGEERNHLELALIQLKADEKFLKAESQAISSQENVLNPEMPADPAGENKNLQNQQHLELTEKPENGPAVDELPEEQVPAGSVKAVEY